MATGAVLAVRLHPSAYLAPLLVFGWAGVLISAVDLRTHLIPTRLLRACAAVAVMLVCAAAVLDGGVAGLARASAAAALGAALGWGAMYVIWRAARGGLGYGDVRLGGYLGLHLGLGGLSAVWAGLLAGFAIAAAVGAVGIVVLGRGADHRFALGPSLIIGALAAAWWFLPPGLTT
jgi:leader peptidase (prepilin peptidase)/N-methyltransferase